MDVTRGARFASKSEGRREAVRVAAEVLRAHGGSDPINGIDYLEVRSQEPSLLDLYFILPLAPGLRIAEHNIKITGGQGGHRIHVRDVLHNPDRDDRATHRITLRVDPPDDTSRYTLRLVGVPRIDGHLAAIEFSFYIDPSPELREVDCSPPRAGCPVPKLDEPILDYLARDYASFRRLILDRLSVIIPDWRERNPADLGIALVEILALTGDHLSYLQDSVATEAYLGTARRRSSVKRHARLLDYSVEEGCNARVWVCFEVERRSEADGATLPAHTPLLAELGPSSAEKPNTASGTAPGLVFETLHDLDLHSARNQLRFHTWSDSVVMLPAGATRATLVDPGSHIAHGGRQGERPVMLLQPGDVLVFEERLILQTAPDQAPESKAIHVQNRHAVRLVSVKVSSDCLSTDWMKEQLAADRRADEWRGAGLPLLEVEWHPEDALPFCMDLRERQTRSGQHQWVAYGNVALADHGRTVPDEARRLRQDREHGQSVSLSEAIARTATEPMLSPDVVPRGASYRPRLLFSDLTFATPFSPRQAHAAPARAALLQDPQAALPSIRLYEELRRRDEQPWTAQRDLLGNSDGDRAFVVEIESDRSAWLRFGDGTVGARPAAGTRLLAEYRVGSGRVGNIDAGAITSFLEDEPRLYFRQEEEHGMSSWSQVFPSSGLRVHNPLPASGGTDPEQLEDVRNNAPAAISRQLRRAVTESDYVTLTEQHPEVQRAAVTARWTGSFWTMFITVDRKGGRPVDAAFEETIRAYLEPCRLAGYSIEVEEPDYVPLKIGLWVSVRQDAHRREVERALNETFSSGTSPDGTPGFFHPDNFSFGQPVYLSQVISRAMAVRGVEWVEPRVFRRMFRAGDEKFTEFQNGAAKPGGSPTDPQRLDEGDLELINGVIPIDGLEIARLDNDPDAPHRGLIRFQMDAGR